MTRGAKARVAGKEPGRSPFSSVWDRTDLLRVATACWRKCVLHPEKRAKVCVGVGRLFGDVPAQTKRDTSPRSNQSGTDDCSGCLTDRSGLTEATNGWAAGQTRNGSRALSAFVYRKRERPTSPFARRIQTGLVNASDATCGSDDRGRRACLRVVAGRVATGHVTDGRVIRVLVVVRSLLCRLRRRKRKNKGRRHLAASVRRPSSTALTSFPDTQPYAML